MNSSFNQIITEDPVMLGIKDASLRIADADTPVLLVGSNGTGRQLLAQAIHENGNRAGDFVVWKCLVPEYDPALLVMRASGGTLFLSGVDDLDAPGQARLLHLLEENTTGVRVAASVQSPARLRQELLYYLGVNVLQLPDLAERQGDVEILTTHFISYFNQKTGKEIRGVTAPVRQIFLAYGWPGNVRELKSVIEGAFNLSSSDRIGRSDIPAYMTKGDRLGAVRGIYSDALSYQENLDAFERQFLMEQLARFGSKKELAEHFGISKQTLNYRLNKLGLKEA